LGKTPRNKGMEGLDIDDCSAGEAGSRRIRAVDDEGNVITGTPGQPRESGTIATLNTGKVPTAAQRLARRASAPAQTGPKTKAEKKLQAILVVKQDSGQKEPVDAERAPVQAKERREAKAVKEKYVMMSASAVDAAAAADAARSRRDKKVGQRMAHTILGDADVIADVIPDFTEESDAMGVTVGLSEASSSVDSVRSLSQEAVDTAWASWHTEFSVQIKIWDSQALFRNAQKANLTKTKGAAAKPPEKPPEAEMKEALEKAVVGVSAKSDIDVAFAAVAAMEAAVAADPEWAIVGGGTRNALSALSEATTRKQRCLRLIELLELAGKGTPEEADGSPSSAPSPRCVEGDTDEELETLLDVVNLPRGIVEYRARRVLGLPLARRSA